MPSGRSGSLGGALKGQSETLILAHSPLLHFPVPSRPCYWYPTSPADPHVIVFFKLIL